MSKVEDTERFFDLLKAGVVFGYQDIMKFNEYDQECFLAAGQLFDKYKQARLKEALCILLPDQLTVRIMAAQTRATMRKKELLGV